jgi:hypothetical protein
MQLDLCWRCKLWLLQLAPQSQFQQPRNQPISQRAENRPRRAHPSLRVSCLPLTRGTRALCAL